MNELGFMRTKCFFIFRQMDLSMEILFKILSPIEYQKFASICPGKYENWLLLYCLLHTLVIVCFNLPLRRFP